MQTILPREEAVEGIFSEILASPTACEQLRDVFYEHLDEEHGIDFDESEHFIQVLFNAYKNGDVTALLLELCGGSMFDLLREAFLIPKKFHGKSGENPVLLTDVDGNILEGKEKKRKFPDMSMKNSKKYMTDTNVHHVLNYIWQMDTILYVPIQKEWNL